MLNTQFNGRLWPAVRMWLAALGGLLLAGACAAPAQQGAGTAVNQMRTDLDARQYSQVLDRSSQFLSATPAGPGAAETLYLRGRAFEDRPSASPAEAQADLQSARTAYVQALDHHPAPKLEAYIRAGIANVSYFQQDYTTAWQQWMAAYPRLDTPDLKSWALYRAGVSRQRLGQFSQADSIFKQVEDEFPNTTPAARAVERRGARAFYVQLGAFGTPVAANTTAANARRQGLSVRVTVDAQKHHVVQAGPLSTYAAAEQLRQKLGDEYEGAFVFP